MTEKVTHGSMGGGWRPGMAVRVRHRQPKGTANGWAGLQPRRQPSTLQKRNVLDHLPESEKRWVGRKLTQAYREPDCAEAKAALERRVDQLEVQHPGSADGQGSIPHYSGRRCNPGECSTVVSPRERGGVTVRLTQLKVANFRCFRNETTVDLDPITVIVGRNDSGKSSLFDALQIFFDEQGIEPDDRSVHSPDALVRISCIFDELPLSLVLDEQHATTLRGEYLLNSRGLLEIVKTYDCSGSKAKLRGVYARANHPSAEHYADLLSLTNARLKQRARELQVNLQGVNQSINAELRRAIWGHCVDLQLQEREIELKSEDAGRMWDRLKSYFPLFALFKSDRPSTDQDAEAQDPMKAAVKEAIRSQQETLDEITSRVKRELQEIANRTVEKIREMDPYLASQLTPRVATKSWDSIFSVNLASDEGIPINKRGSGTRRLVLLNFFRANAEREAAGRGVASSMLSRSPKPVSIPTTRRCSFVPSRNWWLGGVARYF